MVENNKIIVSKEKLTAAFKEVCKGFYGEISDILGGMITSHIPEEEDFSDAVLNQIKAEIAIVKGFGDEFTEGIVIKCDNGASFNLTAVEYLSEGQMKVFFDTPHMFSERLSEAVEEAVENIMAVDEPNVIEDFIKLLEADEAE